MIWEHGAIYYTSKEFFDFDSACYFFTENGLVLYTPEMEATKRSGLAGLILEIDEAGDYRGLTYEEAKEAAHRKKLFKLRLDLDAEGSSDIVWWILCKDSLFIQLFCFNTLVRIEQSIAVKIIFDFFLQELPKNSLLGMYIDKEDKTEEFDWAHFFVDEKARLDVLPNTVCVRKEKLDHVNIREGYIVQPLGHDFYVITNDPAVLCRLPLG